MKKRTFVAVLAASAIILASGSAFAYNGMGRGACPGYGQGIAGQNLTPEKQQALATVIKESDQRLIPLQEKASAKRLELNALSGNSNVKPEIISKLAEEVASLGSQIRKEFIARNEAIAKETGLNVGAARMMAGNGPRGNGDGYGRGHGGRGGNGGRGHGGGQGAGNGGCIYQ